MGGGDGRLTTGDYQCESNLTCTEAWGGGRGQQVGAGLQPAAASLSWNLGTVWGGGKAARAGRRGRHLVLLPPVVHTTLLRCRGRGRVVVPRCPGEPGRCTAVRSQAPTCRLHAALWGGWCWGSGWAQQHRPIIYLYISGAHGLSCGCDFERERQGLKLLLLLLLLPPTRLAAPAAPLPARAGAGSGRPQIINRVAPMGGLPTTSWDGAGSGPSGSSKSNSYRR